MRPCATRSPPLLAKLGYRGILDLDIRLDERTGDYHLLDFNPRLGAQFRVFRDNRRDRCRAGRLPRPDRSADTTG